MRYLWDECILAQLFINLFFDGQIVTTGNIRVFMKIFIIFHLIKHYWIFPWLRAWEVKLKQNTLNICFKCQFDNWHVEDSCVVTDEVWLMQAQLLALHYEWLPGLHGNIGQYHRPASYWLLHLCYSATHAFFCYQDWILSLPKMFLLTNYLSRIQNRYTKLFSIE